MKKHFSIKLRPSRLLGVLLTVAGAAAAHAAAPALTGQLIARPVTPNNVAVYGLPANTAYSGGINTVGVGVPLYLEVDINNAIPVSGITNVSFVLVSKPAASSAVLNVTNPFPTNMGVYEPSDQLIYQVAGRAVFQADVTGQYVVTATVGTTASGMTNYTYNISAATYLGASVCELCHSGGIIAQEEFQYWTNTAHSMIFTEGINGQLGSYSVSCLKCHTVGYNTNAASYADNGFYAIQLQDGWTFPTVLTNSNFANMPANLQNLGNIQCENCHGPGSEHASAFGNTNVSNWPRLTVTVNSGDCTQCHDDPPHHYYGTEWLASKHAVTTTIPSGAGRGYCVQCHTDYGFQARIDYTGTNATTFAPTNTINTTYAAIGCQTCHEPHGNTLPTDANPHLIRTLVGVTFGDGTVITNAGESELCIECHHSRDGGASNNVVAYAAGQLTYPGGSSFGPHDGVQGDMIEGVNAITYGQTIPSSAHRETVTNLCVGCHMQAVLPGDPAFLQAGGHTFEMTYNVVSNGVTNVVAKTDVCAQCHGPLTTFNFPVEDYANTGIIQGVQTEVQILLNQLSTLLPNASGVLDGAVKSSLSVTTKWTQAQLQAAYDWQYVANDGSLGIHNAPFATGILKASIANLSGTSVPGGLPDAWEIAYFGSITNAYGAPNADPAGDGIPNWLKYALGLNPNVAGLSVPNGVVYADDTGSLLGSTNTIQIYTAADVTFNTMVGTTYQLQEVSSLGGGWQNVGAPMLATNTAAFSYLTPTRGNLQQFFRVVHTP
jgi:hypothetical protein